MESMRLRMLSKHDDDNIYLKDSNKLDKDLLNLGEKARYLSDEMNPIIFQTNFY